MSAEQQKEIDYGAPTRNSRVVNVCDDIRTTLSEAIAHLGVKSAAALCGCNMSDLSGAIGKTPHRTLRIEWILTIADAVPMYREPIMTALASFMGFRVEGRRPLTDGEKLERAERALASFGEQGTTILKGLYR